MIVGAGVAGCALAAKLAAPGRTVVLIEAGERLDGTCARMPAGGALLAANPRYASSAHSEPDATAARGWSWADVAPASSVSSGGSGRRSRRAAAAAPSRSRPRPPRAAATTSRAPSSMRAARSRFRSSPT